MNDDNMHIHNYDVKRENYTIFLDSERSDFTSDFTMTYFFFFNFVSVCTR